MIEDGAKRNFVVRFWLFASTPVVARDKIVEYYYNQAV